jgi:hypothetical protein
MVEITLAERITLAAWRLRRVVRFETEQIRLNQENAQEAVGRSLKYDLEYDLDSDEDEPRKPLGVQGILDEAEWNERCWERMSILLDASDDTTQTENEAQELIWLALNQLGKPDMFDPYWKQLPAVKAWTIGYIRQLVRGLTDQYQKPFDEFLRTLGQQVAEAAAQSSQKANLARVRMEQYRREHLLPDTGSLEKIQRYESHLSRQFHRDLHELQRLQATRLGHPVVAPIAIDVDVATESNSEPGGAE